MRTFQDARSPPRAVPRFDIRSIHLIHLLQCQSTGLGDEEVHINEAKAQHTEEDKQDKRPDIFRDTGREEREQEVPDPVRCCAQGDRFGSDAQGEGFAEVDPRCWAPKHAEGEDMEDCEGDDGVSALSVSLGEIGWFRASGGEGVVPNQAGDERTDAFED